MASNCSQEYPNLETTIPPELLAAYPNEVKIGVGQWSQVTAWMWTDLLAFAGDPEKAKQEKLLKTFIFEQLKVQAQSSAAYIAYGDPTTQAAANAASETIRNLLLGKNEEIRDFPSEINKDFTLSVVIKKLTGSDLITVSDPTFGNLFLFQVTTNSFSGEVVACDSNGDDVNKNKYILFLAFPPRPELGPWTVTYQQLYDWAHESLGRGKYLPPSPYIPIAGT